jgi:hypothetical protein
MKFSKFIGRSFLKQTFLIMEGGSASLLIWANPTPKVLGKSLESMFKQRTTNPDREVTTSSFVTTGLSFQATK